MKKLLWYTAICGVLLLAILGQQYHKFQDQKLHLVFCNVGQGDAILIRTPGEKNILIDGGPDRSVLDCLNRHVPIWDRHLHYILLTHPHNDHFAGLIDVLERYETDHFATERLSNSTQGFATLMQQIAKLHLPVTYLTSGQELVEQGVILTIVGPSTAYLRKTSPHGKILETKEFASLVTEITFGTLDVLLTGDSQTIGLRDAVKHLKNKPVILQMPHHGSKTGIDKKMIRLLKPKLGIISVGKNTYGHPSQEVLTICSQEDIPVLRTDKSGDIELISDGRTWQVATQKTQQ